MKIEVGSKWRNKRSGVVSEVVLVERDDVVLLNARGARRKYAQHVPFDYEPVEDAARKSKEVG